MSSPTTPSSSVPLRRATPLASVPARAPSRALLAVAVSMLGHGPQAEDAVHDAFLIALRRIGELRDPAAARAWLLAILVNFCRGALRRPAVDRRRRAPTGRRHGEVAIDTAMRDWVSTALERFSEPLRLAVMLRYFTGASSYEAIADICGVPVGTVRSRLSAARASSPRSCYGRRPSHDEAVAHAGASPRRARRCGVGAQGDPRVARIRRTPTCLQLGRSHRAPRPRPVRRGSRGLRGRGPQPRWARSPGRDHGRRGELASPPGAAALPARPDPGPLPRRPRHQADRLPFARADTGRSPIG